MLGKVYSKMTKHLAHLNTTISLCMFVALLLFNVLLFNTEASAALKAKIMPAKKTYRVAQKKPSFLSIDGDVGEMGSYYYIKMTYSNDFLEVRTTCELRFQADDGETCFNDLIYYRYDEGVLQKIWEHKNIEGDDVYVSEGKNYIFVFSYGCCGGDSSTSIYTMGGTFIGSAIGQKYNSVEAVTAIWKVLQPDGTLVEKCGFVGENNEGLFLYKWENKIKYKGKYPDIVGSRWNVIRVINDNDIELDTEDDDGCVTVYYKINEKSRTLDFVKIAQVSCNLDTEMPVAPER